MSQTVLLAVGQPDMRNMSPSARKIIEILSNARNEVDSAELVSHCPFSKRQCYYSLKKLIESGIVTKSICLYDARKAKYRLVSRIENAKAAASVIRVM